VGVGEVFDHLLVGGRLLQRVQVVALEVFDKGLLERVPIRGLAHDRRDRLQAGASRGPPATLSRDELEAVTRGAD